MLENAKMRNHFSVAPLGNTLKLSCRSVDVCHWTFIFQNRYKRCICEYRSCHVFQVPLCSPKDLKCVDRISLNDATCLKPCSGLIVSSLSKTELKQNVEDLLYFAEDYNTYKIITPSPYFRSNGKKLILNLFHFIKVF